MKKILATIIVCAMPCATLTCYAETLTLDECVALARQNNRTLQNAALDIQMATEQSDEAYANYYPQIKANVMAFQAFDKIIKADGTLPQELALLGQINPVFDQIAGKSFSLQEFDRAYSVTLSAMLPLYAGGQITTGNKLAGIGKEVSQLQLQLKEKDVVQKVTENYWQIATLSYNLRTIEAAEKQIDAVKQQVENYVNAGVTTRNALLKVNLRSQELSSNRLKLENARHILLMLLAQQIGVANEGFDIVTPSADAAPPLPQHAGYGAGNREELQLAQKNMEAQQLQVKMERGKLLPTVAIGVMGYHAGMGGFSTLVENHIKTTSTNAMALATVSVPISDWWGGKHAIRRAKAKQQQAENNYLNTQEKLRIDNETAWCNLIEAHKQIDIARASVEEAEENFRMSQNQYSVGKETITDLLDAETLLRQSKDRLSSSLATYHIRMADYKRKTE